MFAGLLPTSCDATGSGLMCRPVISRGLLGSGADDCALLWALEDEAP